MWGENMGGGGKKPTLSQLTKRMERERRQQQERREAAGYEKSVLGLSVPDMEEVVSYVKSLKYVTPYVLAEKFGFRLSLAKRLLSDFVSQGLLNVVAGDNRLRIYAPVVEPTPAAEAREAAQPEATKRRKRGKRSKEGKSSS